MKSISGYAADKLLSPHNQDCSMMIVGARGRGKSTAAIDIAIKTSNILAYKLGGKPEDYFSVDDIAIISRPEIARVLRRKRKYQIAIFDDIGLGWSARNWQDEVNKILNDILQIFRTNKTFLILTVPDAFLIDKAPRKLLELFAEMEQGYFDLGFSTAKVFKITPKPRTGETFYSYPVDHSKFIRYKFYKPDTPLYVEYLNRREAYANELQEQKLARLEEIFIEEQAETSGSAKIKKHNMLPEIDKDIMNGVSKTEACTRHGMTPRYYNMLKKTQAYKLEKGLSS